MIAIVFTLAALAEYSDRVDSRGRAYARWLAEKVHGADYAAQLDQAFQDREDRAAAHLASIHVADPLAGLRGLTWDDLDALAA